MTTTENTTKKDKFHFLKEVKPLTPYGAKRHLWNLFETNLLSKEVAEQFSKKLDEDYRNE